MNRDRLQAQRFELKFQITESTAHALRPYLRVYLVPDDFGANADLPAYPVDSLYLDSPDLQLYRTTINGDRNRYKLRVRYYDDNPASPVYLEIKRRVDRCILKQRVLVHRWAVPALIAGAPPTADQLVQPDAATYQRLHHFCRCLRDIDARPRAHVAYDREAWRCPRDGSVRVTLDRAIRCEPQPEVVLTRSFRSPVTVFTGQVVLELKFTDRFPTWLATLVRTFSLQQTGAAKYVDGINACDPRALQRTASLRRRPFTPPVLFSAPSSC